jgi:hypothetical protein
MKRSDPYLVLLGALYVWEISALCVLLKIYNFAIEPNILAVFPSRLGAVVLIASACVFAASLVIIHQFRKIGASGSNAHFLTLGMNIASVVICLLVGEVTVRLLSVQIPAGFMVGETTLRPFMWKEASRRFKEKFAMPAPTPPFRDDDSRLKVFDDRLGWAYRSNRRSDKGLYCTKELGIRGSCNDGTSSNRVDEYRIALVGNSFTFGQEVPYEESWGGRLEESLGPDVRVLNFGVTGYSVAQAFLRYERDVRPTHPDVVILGFINDDLLRTRRIYQILSFPTWGAPKAHPRFVLNNGQLVLLNVPLPTPDAIVTYSSVRDLPFIEYDSGYDPVEWEGPYWTPFQYSMLFRFVTSWYSHSEKKDMTRSDEEMFAVNAEIFQAFVRLAESEGSIPMVMFLPSYEDLDRKRHNFEGYLPLGIRVLETSGVKYLDARTCFQKVEYEDYFEPVYLDPSRHYSSQGNATISQCLTPMVRDLLSAGSVGSRNISVGPERP